MRKAQRDSRKFSKEQWLQVFENLQALDSLGLLSKQPPPKRQGQSQLPK
jgi:hypothetical protein